MSIQVFACDHRKNVEWNLPYIRVGSTSSDALIKISNKYDPILSEGSQILGIYENLQQFGRPDYIGFCHYRRFFTCAQVQQSIINISQSQFNSKFCLTSDHQQYLLQSAKADGILMNPILVINPSVQYQYIWDQIYILEKENMMKKEYLKTVFDIFYDNCPNSLKPHIEKAFIQKPNYLCNLFTLKTDIFVEYCNIIKNTVDKILETIPSDVFSSLHPRCLGYILERFTSSYLHAKTFSGSNFIHMPLMTLNGEVHEKWEKNKNV